MEIYYKILSSCMMGLDAEIYYINSFLLGGTYDIEI